MSFLESSIYFRYAYVLASLFFKAFLIYWIACLLVAKGSPPYS
jgi:hypothetical protein